MKVENKLKIFSAVISGNEDAYLENEIEKWQFLTPKLRTIQNVHAGFSGKNILVFVIYTEDDQAQMNQRERVLYLRDNFKRIWGRTLEYEELKDAGFTDAILRSAFSE